MNVTAASYEGGKLILQTDSRDARKLVYQFKPGEYEVKRSRKKRSLDANAYAWVLCSKIAEAVGITKEEVYQNAVQDGDQYLIATIPDSDCDSFCRAWQSRGIGWRVQVADDPGIGAKTLFAYYGSSVYDTKAMSRLIDGLVQDAKSMGIETMPPDELRAMLEEWDA